jgi:hypothetical protein
MGFSGLVPFALENVLQTEVGCLEWNVGVIQRLVTLLADCTALEDGQNADCYYYHYHRYHIDCLQPFSIAHK